MRQYRAFSQRMFGNVFQCFQCYVILCWKPYKRYTYKNNLSYQYTQKTWNRSFILLKHFRGLCPHLLKYNMYDSFLRIMDGSHRGWKFATKWCNWWVDWSVSVMIVKGSPWHMSSPGVYVSLWRIWVSCYSYESQAWPENRSRITPLHGWIARCETMVFKIHQSAPTES